MTSRRLFAIVFFCVAATPALADTTIVSESFDSYVDGGGTTGQDKFEAVWRPDDGDGFENIFLDPAHVNLLVPDIETSLLLLDETIDPPTSNPPGLQGVGVLGRKIGGINEYNGSPFEAVPTETESVQYGGDIFIDGTSGNWRHSIGLRNDTLDRDPAFGDQWGLNFLEMGFYNAATCDPTNSSCAPAPVGTQDPADPWYIPPTGFNYRLSLFDSTTKGDYYLNGELVVVLTSTPGYQYFQLPLPLDNAVSPPGDYDGNKIVDASDFTVWRDHLGETGDPGQVPGDGDDGTGTGTPDGVVDIKDYNFWVQEFGTVGEGDGIVTVDDVAIFAADNELDMWHRYTATISDTSVTLELDLFRDGVNNGTGEDGVDASVVVEIEMVDAPSHLGLPPGTEAPFTSLRIGGISGITGNNPLVYDNVFLNMIDVPVPAGASSASAVPEPSAVVLLLLGMAGLMGAGRRR